jgi:23S rRNA (uracil1939-C5)-methyltransferase
VLKIERIVTGGEGIARHEDGRVVFVPRTAPGENVDVEYVEERRQWLRARLVHVVEPSPHRRDAPCPHYEKCDGCQLQHLQYEAQLSVKTSIVADSLRRIGGFDVQAPEIVGSPREFAYRNRITLVLRRRRGEIAFGYHAFDDPSRLISVDRCPLAEDHLNDALSIVSDAAPRIGGGMPREGEWRLTLRVSSEGHVGLAIEGVKRPADVDRSLLAELNSRGLVAVWLVNEKGRIIAHAGLETLAEKWGAYEVPLAGTAFVQVNRDAAARLDAYVREQCAAGAGVRVIDGYCGFGLRACEIAREGADVIGIDSDRHAVRAAMVIAAEKGLSIRFVAERVEDDLSKELPADIVILNPPRGGVAPEVVGALLREPPPRVIYVSCDPATLGRDLKNLSGAFALETIRAFDLFPQTAHVETVATLARRPATGGSDGAAFSPKILPKE